MLALVDKSQQTLFHHFNTRVKGALSRWGDHCNPYQSPISSKPLYPKSITEVAGICLVTDLTKIYHFNALLVCHAFPHIGYNGERKMLVDAPVVTQ
jgi:hypothetical protein